MRTAFSLLVLCAFVGCSYGSATPESCHAKYIRDRKGHGEDNYEACLARANGSSEVVQDDLAELKDVVIFETGCKYPEITVLDRTGSAATTVAVDACGERIVFRRQLRLHLGMRSTRNTVWERATPVTAGL